MKTSSERMLSGTGAVPGVKTVSMYFFRLLLAIVAPVMAASLASCSGNEMPDVKLSLDVDDKYVVGNVIHVAQGEPIVIKDVKVTNNEVGKTAVIDEVNFYWDEVHLGYRAKAPFEIIIPTTKETKIGKHKICVACRVIAEGKSLAEAFTEFIVMVDEPEVKTNE